MDDSGFDFRTTIAHKRDGGRLDQAAMTAFARGVIDGDISDAQAAAMLMAIYVRGLDLDETVALTDAIASSGKRMDFSDFGPVVDKHSTGGVGDTVSLIAGPIAAACGCIVPMLSGRALGHTGGTLDKLASIPGINVQLDSDDMRRTIARAGITIAEASADLAPADGILYALRNATSTVGQIGLIVASILGKKLCTNPTSLVLDVKVGSGGFLPDLPSAQHLVERMRAVGDRLSLEIIALYTDMSQPLSSAIGNGVEVDRAVRILRGDAGSAELQAGRGGLHGARLRTLSIEVAARMIALAHRVELEAARSQAEDALGSGRALERLRKMIEVQGGSSRVVEHPNVLINPARTQPIVTAKRGTVVGWDPRRLGEAVVALGNGSDANSDPQAGIHLHIDLGEAVEPDDTIAVLYSTGDQGLDHAHQLVGKALQVGDAEPPPPLFIDSESTA